MKKAGLILCLALIILLSSFFSSALYVVDSAVSGGDSVAVSTPTEKKTLGDIENLTFVKGVRGAVTLAWDKLEGAYAYKIFVKASGDTGFRYMKTVKENEITIKNLGDEGGLKFRVRGYCFDGGRVVYGGKSSVVTAVTAPGDVEKLYTRSITDDSITLYWDKAPGATGYGVYLYNKESEKFSLYKDTSRTTLTVSGLEKNTRYSFKVVSYKNIDNSITMGNYSPIYKEYTYNGGELPKTKAQAARYYNDMINSLKNEENMQVKYKKSIDTSFFSCSRQNLSNTVKNTLRLFEGTLNKTYNFADGKADNKSANRLVEPYGKKATLARDDIESFEAKENKNGLKLTVRLKSEEMASGKTTAYFDGVISMPHYYKLKTSPLVIEDADSYYSGGTLSVTVSGGKIKKLSITASALSDITFSISDVRATTLVGYGLKESYDISYK